MKRLFYNIYYWIKFKFNNPEDITLHPRFDVHIKYGFSVGSKHYYRCLHDYDIRESRFRYLKTYFQEVENKLTAQDIQEFADATIEYMNKNKMIEAGQLMKELKYRSEWLFEPTSLYKYASVIYFDLGENILDYDMTYNHAKIRYWSKKKELLRMLLKELMTGAETLLNLSNEDFEHYISVLQQKKDEQQNLILASGVCESNKSTEQTI